jgi:hypothetical protein
MGHLERRILEVNRKRIKVVKPGSKTSFPTTEARGTYTPPFHVSSYHDNMYFFFHDILVPYKHLEDNVNSYVILAG